MLGDREMEHSIPKYKNTEDKGIMKIAEAKKLSPEKFAELDEAYSGFEMENTKNHPIRDEGESFMDFIKKGSEKIKTDPTVKKILG